MITVSTNASAILLEILVRVNCSTVDQTLWELRFSTGYILGGTSSCQHPVRALRRPLILSRISRLELACVAREGLVTGSGDLVSGLTVLFL